VRVCAHRDECSYVYEYLRLYCVSKKRKIKTKTKVKKTRGGGGRSIVYKKTRGGGGGMKPKKVIKEEESNIKVLTHELLPFTLQSNANCSVIFQSFKSLFMHSSHVKVGLPQPLFPLLVRLITLLRIGASGGLRWICPNNLK
jgi:hypothetical protein